jgi:hypothetical protein
VKTLFNLHSINHNESILRGTFTMKNIKNYTGNILMTSMLALASICPCLGQSGGNCTYMNNSNQSPACGGDPQPNQEIACPVFPVVQVFCAVTDSVGTLPNCQGGAVDGGLICSSGSTKCTYTRTYSSTLRTVCLCATIAGGTIPPTIMTSTVQWPQPSGTCNGSGA